MPANQALVGAHLRFRAAWDNQAARGILLANACTAEIPRIPTLSDRKMIDGIGAFPKAMSTPTDVGVPITRYVQ